MVTLLRDGFGFELESRNITFTYLVDGSEVDWSLGMAISHFAEDHVHAVSVRNSELDETEENGSMSAGLETVEFGKYVRNFAKDWFY